ncbi:hypothetical protein Q1695_008463 [Nippostrongylus brasiliensis]|nr:hypothetical protein Q1695_008463 [Nippostrongylus brasiliensis]
MAIFHATAVGSIELAHSRDLARTDEFHSRSRNESSTRIHRLDLQGLRGVAILSVLGFHFFPGWFPNGYVGVDQFFVLSGYLLARILDNDPTSILDFYYRRSKRIVPMYVLATLLTLWSCFFLYPESILNLNVKSAMAAVTFISNFWPLERKYTGYFAELAVADDLFIHTWSLAVEVQFYLIVPVLSILCKKTSFRISATCLIVIGALSLAFHLLSDATTAFYNPLARLWEFLTGYLAYLMSSRTAIEPALCEKPRNSAECEQVVKIATTMVTGVIVAYGNNLLSSRCFVHFGDISYTLYLVHWPIFCWLKLSGNCNASDRMAGALFAWFLSVLLTRTYETWYRAADKYTIVVMIIILYALTGVTLVQSHNVKAFVNEYNLSLDRQIAAEDLYTNITLGIAAVNFYLTFLSFRKHGGVEFFKWGEIFALLPFTFAISFEFSSLL